MKENIFKKVMKKLNRNLLILDGGFATQAEFYGANINNNPLWASKLLYSNTKLIKKIHKDYLKNGSDIIISSSYQASIDGFKKEYGLSYQKCAEIMGKSIDLACESVLEVSKEMSRDMDSYIVVISIGCFGVTLHNGSEYDGNYLDKTHQDIRQYYTEKIGCFINNKLFNSCNIIYGFETIPRLDEVGIICDLMNEYKISGYISLCCQNGSQLCDGNKVTHAIKTILNNNKYGYIIGIGFNCLHPKFVSNLILTTKNLLQSNKDTHISIIVYPNSGEKWDGINKKWIENTQMTNDQFTDFALQWYANGASIIGGCCRTNPSTIHAIKKALTTGIRNPHLTSKL